METSTVAVLRGVPFFADMDEHSLELLASACRKRRYDADETLFFEGDPGHTLYIILSGRVNIQKITPSGEILFLNQCGPGEAFGELALVDGKPRSADAVTAETCELLVLDQRAFARCLESSPKVTRGILAFLADRVRAADTRLQAYQSRDALGRVSDILLRLLEVSAVPHPGGGKRITARITQQDMAEQIASTRETVNRALSRLRQTGVIRCEGRQFIVMDEDKLRDYASR